MTRLAFRETVNGGGMTHDNKTVDDVHAAVGYQHLSRFWAKVEILFGLGAAGVGMLLGFWAVRQTVQLAWAGAALLLFMLGWYLALAGTRTHVYRSLSDLTALLLEEIRRTRAECQPPEPDVNPAGITRDEHSRR
jgi:hypothetical protein